jgi:hypothetical protein
MTPLSRMAPLQVSDIPPYGRAWPVACPRVDSVNSQIASGVDFLATLEYTTYREGVGESHLALYLLGPPRIERNGVPIQVDTRKAIALLAYLAVAGENRQRPFVSTHSDPSTTTRTAVLLLVEPSMR